MRMTDVLHFGSIDAPLLARDGWPTSFVVLPLPSRPSLLASLSLPPLHWGALTPLTPTHVGPSGFLFLFRCLILLGFFVWFFWALAVWPPAFGPVLWASGRASSPFTPFGGRPAGLVIGYHFLNLGEVFTVKASPWKPRGLKFESYSPWVEPSLAVS